MLSFIFFKRSCSAALVSQVSLGKDICNFKWLVKWRLNKKRRIMYCNGLNRQDTSLERFKFDCDFMINSIIIQHGCPTWVGNLERGLGIFVLMAAAQSHSTVHPPTPPPPVPSWSSSRTPRSGKVSSRTTSHSCSSSVTGNYMKDLIILESWRRAKACT
jgi:hypothetical protein